MGHRHIAMATVPGYDSDEQLSPQRFAHLNYLGYRATMAKLGLPEQVFVAPGRREDVTSQFDRSVPLGADLARANPRPTAVIAFSEYAAAGLMVGLAEQGVRVPEDISIVAGGEQPFARMLRPALTTLAAPYEQMGEVATRMLLDMIDGGGTEPVASVSLEASLIMRDSVRELARP
jgi:DNA-binding LacI/PurR family transcriptional regulator